MEIPHISKMPIARIKVRGLVKCNDDYLFIRRTHFGHSKSFLICPGGRIEKSDLVIHNGQKNLEMTLKKALQRELIEELAATGIEVGSFLSVSRLHKHSREVLFSAKIESYDWNARTGSEFSNVNLGSFELIKIRHFDKSILGRRGYRFEPKEWRKLIPQYALDQLGK